MGSWGELHHIPTFSHLNPLPKSLAMHPAPPSPNHPLWSPEDMKFLILQIRLQDLPLQLLSQLWRRPFQPPVTSPNSGRGHQTGVQVLGWGLQGGAINIMGHYLCPCEKGPLRVRLVYTPCHKTFFNLDVLRCHKKVISINKIKGIITWVYIDSGE